MDLDIVDEDIVNELSNDDESNESKPKDKVNLAHSSDSLLLSIDKSEDKELSEFIFSSEEEL